MHLSGDTGEEMTRHSQIATKILGFKLPQCTAVIKIE